MYHVRITVRGADPHALAAVEAAVLEAVGECYVYPVARLSRADGYSTGQALEFTCTSPGVASALAAEASDITGESAELTIDGRWFPGATPTPRNWLDRPDERTSA